MEFIIVFVIVIVAGYIFYSNVKKQANGDCGCGNGCKGCSQSCDTKPSIKNNSKIQ
ncbi:FeoB-associated Cys-rich membrane protein [Clostridium estertheticum]|uniref:FeoB-associated Cys-rich membrane protein n=1 Tax=Clostridium estertheticum TaxID=238834 RepID=UPI0013E8F60D|nr:FeoB-associated Cys-rich membrane protein [Clostridium estertheticum]MBZ9688438.1 FeoB-associated Cys-rich membrane protein [Clostridium estertheticum]